MDATTNRNQWNKFKTPWPKKKLSLPKFDVPLDVHTDKTN